ETGRGAMYIRYGPPAIEFKVRGDPATPGDQQLTRAWIYDESTAFVFYQMP
ncbi:MAG: hypothetical protein GWN85_40535, partial [Gemmatimonadetes bacterium]|nr:hypothetical protein [Gemmatimonadota bacterium]